MIGLQQQPVLFYKCIQTMLLTKVKEILSSNNILDRNIEISLAHGLDLCPQKSALIPCPAVLPLLQL